MFTANYIAFSCLFQFTHPGRGATSAAMTRSVSSESFNSRTPGGVRLHVPDYTVLRNKFQFTHPGRGATVWCKVAYYGADKQA